ncbi:hypothetical protein ABZV67_18735 [Streptomyces sp. NPDC005065]|uniref:hypothetical protein n=1 Tax=unclassified Streptomyces TaxID=2593676 RepID=UPI0033AAE6E3
MVSAPGVLWTESCTGARRSSATTADELLKQLLPGQRPDVLSVLTAAHGEESARLLARTRLRGVSMDGDVALLVRDVLLAEDWQVGPDYFVADPLLRSLLLHRLRFQDGDHPHYAMWRAVHESLRAAYVPGGSFPSVPHRLRQELVLGGAGACVTHLRVQFALTDVMRWLGALRFIAAAPYPRAPGSSGPDPRRAIALGQESADSLPTLRRKAPEDASQRFVAIAWPEGKPPARNCLPPPSAP